MFCVLRVKKCMCRRNALGLKKFEMEKVVKGE